MLSKRIIACLDVRDGQVVKGINFEGLRSAGDPAELARRYNAEGHRRARHPRHHRHARAAARARRHDPRRRARALHSARRRRRHPDRRRCGGGGRRRRRQGEPEHRGARRSRRSSRRSPTATAARRSSSRSTRSATASGFAVYARSGQTAAGPRRGRVGARGRGARRRRDPADVDRSRRHQGRLRLRADGRRVARRVDSRHRVGRRRRARPLRRRLHDGRAPTPRWPRRSFTTPKRACASSSSTCSDAASRCDCESRSRVPTARDSRLQLPHADSLDRSQGRRGRAARPGRAARHQGRRRVPRGCERFERFPEGAGDRSRRRDGRGRQPRARPADRRRAAVPRRRRHPHGRARAQDMLAAGAQQVIAGSALFKDGQPDLEFAQRARRRRRRRTRHRRRRQPRRPRRHPRLEDARCR